MACESFRAPLPPLFRNARKPLWKIAQELGVDAVAVGRVLRSSARVRITAQLIAVPEAETESHLWAHVYDRDMQDVLRLQAELAQAIGREIHGSLERSGR